MKIVTAAAVVGLALSACTGDAAVGIGELKGPTAAVSSQATTTKVLVVTSPKGRHEGASQISLVWTFVFPSGQRQDLKWTFAGKSFIWPASECMVEYLDM